MYIIFVENFHFLQIKSIFVNREKRVCPFEISFYISIVYIIILYTNRNKLG